MTKIDYSKVPAGYAHCVARKCVMRDTCLRAIAWESMPDEIVKVSVLNPAHTNESESCSRYSSSEPVRYGRGFVSMQEAMSGGHYTQFRILLTERMGRNHYFDCRNGNVRTKPSEMQLIADTLREIGADPHLPFDAYEEDYLWQ